MEKVELYGTKPVLLRVVNFLRRVITRRKGWLLVGMSQGFYKILSKQGVLK